MPRYASLAPFMRSGATRLIAGLGSCVIVTLCLALLSSGARADDNVDKLIEQLTTSKAYKVRLSAALNLAKLDDKRAIEPFIKVLGDEDKTVRGVAAVSLGKLIDGGTDAALRDRAVAALQKAEADDKNEFVREQATKALAAIAKIGTGGASGGGIYIDIGAMAAKVQDSDAMRQLMRKTVEKTMAKKAKTMITTWPGGKAPTKSQLSTAQTAGYHVDGTLVQLDATPKDGGTQVACKVSMLIATFPEKSMFGFLDGGARVQAGTSDKDIQFAKEDCVTAVVENLVETKIIPTIKTRAGSGQAQSAPQARTSPAAKPQSRSKRANKP